MSRIFRRSKAVMEPVELRNISVSDPALVAYFGGGVTAAGQTVSESSALGVTAYYRGVSIISGTVGTLPLKTYRDVKDKRDRVPSFLDDPCAGMLTPFEWVELVLVHLLIHGNAYLLHIFNGAGAIVGLQPLHPTCVTVECAPDGSKLYKVQVADGSTRVFTDADLLHIPALGTDGLVGLSPIALHRQALGTALAGDKAAGEMFASGLMVSGLVSLGETGSLTKEEAKELSQELRNKGQGASNAGRLLFVPSDLKVQPWSLPARDAQFLESRIHQVEEVARMLGIPPHLLGQTEKQTSWGTGVSEQNRGLATYTLRPWTTRLEQRLSRLLPDNQFSEFDYSGLFQGSPREELEMLALQIASKILTVNEARAIRNLPPLTQPEPTQETS